MKAKQSGSLALVLGVLLLGACGSPPAADDTSGGSGTATSPSSGDRFPDVLEAEVTADEDGTYTFDVTMSSPYDTPARYADGWRVRVGDEVYGEMTLTHDHASEQPFTRTQTGVNIPDGTVDVVIEGRDSENGYGGDTVSVPLPPAA